MQGSTIMASTGTDPETRLVHDSSQFSEGPWVSMNSYPQSTLASFSDAEFAYTPPLPSQSVAPQDTLSRMPPLLPRQPASERTDNQRQKQQQQGPEQQEKESQKAQQQQQQQQQTSLPLAQPIPQHHHHHHLPQLHTLMGSSAPTWPSMLIGNSTAYTHQSSLPPPPPLTHPQMMPSVTISTRSGQPPPQPPPLKTKLIDRDGRAAPRKMLTDDDRRRMCEYAEAHPGIKQSEIGNLFGVERSTVSKVLRNREKYMIREERSMSPGRKMKTKFPDIERALSNWVRNAQRSGVPVTDAEIQDKFRFFATSTGSPETVLKANSTSWLEKFKQKNGIGKSRLVRRASETNIPDRRKRAANAAANLSSSPSLRHIESPLSPSGGIGHQNPSVSPLSGHHSDDDHDGSRTGSVGGPFMAFGHHDGSAASTVGGSGSHISDGGMPGTMSMGLGLTGMEDTYKHGTNQSTTSLTSVLTETPVSPFSGSALSPSVPFSFSPDLNNGSFLPSLDHHHHTMAPPGSANFQRPRSQTLPALNLEYINQQHAVPSDVSESMTPKFQQQQQQSQQRQPQHHHLPSTAPSSAVDSPMTDVSAPSYGIDSTVVSPQLRRSNSNSSLLLGASGAGGAGGSGGSSAARPTVGPGGAGTLSGTNNGNGSSSSGGGGSGSGGSSGGGMSPNTPSQDDARRAADTLLTFIQTMPGTFDQTDFIVLSRLVDKLRLQGGGSIGGGVPKILVLSTLSRIPEGEGELGAESQHTVNKMKTTMAA